MRIMIELSLFSSQNGISQCVGACTIREMEAGYCPVSLSIGDIITAVEVGLSAGRENSKQASSLRNVKDSRYPEINEGPGRDTLLHA